MYQLLHPYEGMTASMPTVESTCYSSTKTDLDELCTVSTTLKKDKVFENYDSSLNNLAQTYITQIQGFLSNLPTGTQNTINEVINAGYQPATALINIQKIYSTITDGSITNYFVTDITSTPNKTLFDNYSTAAETISCSTIDSIKLYNFNLPSLTTILCSGFTCTAELNQIRKLVTDPSCM
jgi:hypothetical protein